MEDGLVHLEPVPVHSQPLLKDSFAEGHTAHLEAAPPLPVPALVQQALGSVDGVRGQLLVVEEEGEPDWSRSSKHYISNTRQLLADAGRESEPDQLILLIIQERTELLVDEGRERAGLSLVRRRSSFGPRPTCAASSGLLTHWPTH